MEEQKNLEQANAWKDRIECKVTVSRDKRWIIERIPRSELEKVPDGSDMTIIKPLTFWDKVIQRAKAVPGYQIDKIKE